MDPKRKGSDSGNLDMPKRSRKILSLSKKVSTIQYFESAQVTFIMVYFYSSIFL